MTDLEIRIHAMMSDLTHAERVAAGYMLKNFDSFLTLSSDELADKSQASKATWTRFSKSAGYAGLKELRKAVVHSQQAISADRNSTSDSWLYEAKNNHNMDSMANIIAENNTKAILETVTLIDKEQYLNAGMAIINAESIRIYGLGASGLVGQDLAQKLIRIGKHAMRCNDFHDSLALATSSKPSDVGVFISYSGKTNETVKLMEITKKSGTPVIAITRLGGRIGELADYSLLVSGCEEEKRVGAMCSRIAQLTAVDILFSYILHYDFGDIEHNIKRSYEMSRFYKNSKQ